MLDGRHTVPALVISWVADLAGSRGPGERVRPHAAIEAKRKKRIVRSGAAERREAVEASIT